MRSMAGWGRRRVTSTGHRWLGMSLLGRVGEGRRDATAQRPPGQAAEAEGERETAGAAAKPGHRPQGRTEVAADEAGQTPLPGRCTAPRARSGAPRAATI